LTFGLNSTSASYKASTKTNKTQANNNNNSNNNNTHVFLEDKC